MRKQDVSKIKLRLKKLRAQNMKYHNLSPDYLEGAKKSHVKKAAKFRTAYFRALAKNPFFKDIFSSKRNINLQSQIGNKIFKYKLLRKGIRNPVTGEPVLFMIDSYGRGLIISQTKIGGKIIWFPINYHFENLGNSLVFKKTAGRTSVNEMLGFHEISRKIDAKMSKLGFLETENSSQFRRKLVIAKKYL
jgi:hypothetical protein